MAIGVEYGCKFVLEGPDGSKAVFNDSTDPNFVGALDPENCSGLDRADVREDAAEKTEDDGRVQGNNYYGGRPIVLGGTITASSIISRNEKVDKILAAADAMRADATLTWYPQGGPVSGITLKVRQNQPTRISKRYVKEFQIALVANTVNPTGTTLKTSVRLRREGIAKAGAVTTAQAVTTDATYIYYVVGKDIWRAKLDGTGSVKLVEEATASSGSINGIAVNTTHIFWADSGGGQVGRSKIDGTEKINAFVTTPEAIRGIAISSTNIFWGEAINGNIGRSKIDGTEPIKEWITAPSTEIKNVAVNATHIFWSQLGKIGRATLAGGEVNENWFTEIGSVAPKSLYADANFVYYTTETAAKAAIGRVKTDATGNLYYVIFSELGLAGGKLNDLTVRGNYIYHVASLERDAYAVDRTLNTNKVEVNNEGTVDVSPVIKIWGQYAGTLEITNETDGAKKLVIPLTTLPESGGLDVEDILEIDFANRTIRQTDISKGVVINQYSKLTFASSEWWKLKPGVNVLITDSPFKMEITYRDAYR